MLDGIRRPSAALLIPRVAKRQDHHRARRFRHRGLRRQLQPRVGRRQQLGGGGAEGEMGGTATCEEFYDLMVV